MHEKRTPIKNKRWHDVPTLLAYGDVANRDEFALPKFAQSSPLCGLGKSVGVRNGRVGSTAMMVLIFVHDDRA